MADEVVVAGDTTDAGETEAAEAAIAGAMGLGETQVDGATEAAVADESKVDGEAKPVAKDDDELPVGLTEDAKARIQKRFDKYSGDTKTAKEEKTAAEAKATAAEERAAKAEATLTARTAAAIPDADLVADDFAPGEEKIVAAFHRADYVYNWANKNKDTGAEVTENGVTTTYTAEQIQERLEFLREQRADARADARPILTRVKTELATALIAARSEIRKQRATASTTHPAATPAKPKVTIPPPSNPAGATGAVRTSGRTVTAPAKVETEDDMEQYIAASLTGK